MAQDRANIHIDKSENSDTYDLIITDPAGPDATTRLADRLAGKLSDYTSGIRRSGDGGDVVLSFTADKKPLDKYEAGRINNITLMEHAETEGKEM